MIERRTYDLWGAISEEMMLQWRKTPLNDHSLWICGRYLRCLNVAAATCAAPLLLLSLIACGGQKAFTIVDHPLVLTPQPVVVVLKPSLQAEGATFDFTVIMPQNSLCSFSDWVFYNTAGRQVGITITFVTADGRKDKFGQFDVRKVTEEPPHRCTGNKHPFGRLDSGTLPVYTHVELAASDSITIAGLTVKTGNPELLFP